MTGDASSGVLPTAALSTILTTGQQALIAPMTLFSIEYVPGSPCINAGIDLSATLTNADDFDGHPQYRDSVWVGYSKPFIGAHEYRPKAVHR